jgi:sulfotransferase family protein
MKKPNLFICGAPKCGTTSLAVWLSAHPNIFMSSIKEPHFFNSDHYRSIKSEIEYNLLFQDATENQKVIGEASVWYLYSKEAIPDILRYNNLSKFIVMVRNPVDMVYSLHDQLLFSAYENIKNFEKAWSLQENRLVGEFIPPHCPEPKYLLYGEVCSIGKQLDRLFSKVSKDRVHIVVFDDFKANAINEYQKVLSFLEVPFFENVKFVPYNTAKKMRSYYLHRFMQCGIRIKKKIRYSGGLGIMSAIERKNMLLRIRPSLSLKTRTMLINYFYEDIRLLEKLIYRDLSQWFQ